MSTEGIHVILTGGTIVKSYDPVTEKPEIYEEPIISRYFEKKIKPHCSITFEQVCLKDSLDLTDEDRRNVLKAVINSERKHIIIVHGTSTMDTTADFLKSELDASDKTIVLMGAMIPLHEFAESDAGFNLGYAVSQAQILEPGVYICMNAKSFPAGTVAKNFDQARFEDKA